MSLKFYIIFMGHSYHLVKIRIEGLRDLFFILFSFVCPVTAGGLPRTHRAFRSEDKGRRLSPLGRRVFPGGSFLCNNGVSIFH